MRGKNGNRFQVLSTERLTLRQLKSGDVDGIFALRSSDNVNKYLNRKPSESIADAMTFIRAIISNNQDNNSYYWAITLNGIDKLIGTVCLFDFSNDNLKAEIGYELLPDFQGKGIMQEALSKVIAFAVQDLQLESIKAVTNNENKNSIALLEKFDFKNDGANVSNFTTFTFKI
ncbi:MAG: GNAT family N-acetyltransferase [Pedobacter sp.]